MRKKKSSSSPAPLKKTSDVSRTRSFAVNVRVDEPTHATLRELSLEYDEKMSVLLAEAVKDFRRKKFMEAVNVEYAALRDDPEAWAAERAERAIWDATLTDGLTK